MEYSPIAIFTYNRPEHIKKTIETLRQNSLAKDSNLYIFSDAAIDSKEEEKVYKVREYLKSVSGFKSVKINLNTKNKGLARSIISGINTIFEEYNKVIVLEDDLVTAPNFLSYMNEALNFYNPNQVWSISGFTPKISIPQSYPYSTFPAPRNCSWGWATWKQNWLKTDWEITDFNSFISNKKEIKKFNSGGNDLSIMLLKQQRQIINSWSIRYNYAGFKNNLYTIYPTHSYIQNIGVDGSGTNMKASKKFKINFTQNSIYSINFCPYNIVNFSIIKSFKRFYNTSLYRKCVNTIKIAYYNFNIKK